jgi:redox-sensing transcriptional repressor
MKTPIPIPTLRRYPLYYQHLLVVIGEGKRFISSEELGKATGSAPEQVRKDISFLEGKGRSRVGYSTTKLIAEITACLGLTREKSAILVGVGNLGRAISLYPGFAQYSMRITHLFDNDARVIGTKVKGMEVLPVDRIPYILKTFKIPIGIITTPPESAQALAEVMAGNGIKAIWNFSTAHLRVPDDVMVRNEVLSLELAVILNYIANLDQEKTSKNNKEDSQ